MRYNNKRLKLEREINPVLAAASDKQSVTIARDAEFSRAWNPQALRGFSFSLLSPRISSLRLR